MLRPKKTRGCDDGRCPLFRFCAFHRCLRRMCVIKQRLKRLCHEWHGRFFVWGKLWVNWNPVGKLFFIFLLFSPQNRLLGCQMGPPAAKGPVEWHDMGDGEMPFKLGRVKYHRETCNGCTARTITYGCQLGYPVQRPEIGSGDPPRPLKPCPKPKTQAAMAKCKPCKARPAKN